jgi:hypothetical protein
MTERRHGARRHRRHQQRAALLYQSALDAVDPRVLVAAETAEGLADEVAVVRLLLRRQLEQDPDNLELTLKAMHLLVRMVMAQHQIAGADAAAFDERSAALIEQVRRVFAETGGVTDG